MQSLLLTLLSLFVIGSLIEVLHFIYRLNKLRKAMNDQYKHDDSDW